MLFLRLLEPKSNGPAALAARTRALAFAAIASTIFTTTACSNGGGGSSSSGSSAAAIAAYCPYLPSKTFSTPITISGSAYYEYRTNGNGNISDSITVLSPAATTFNSVYSLTISGNTKTWTCNQVAGCSSATAAAGLLGVINADASLPLSAAGSPALTLTPKNEGPAITLSGLSTNLNASIDDNPNPIRFAEIQVLAADGSIAQCAETAADGSFSFQLPADGTTYSVNVMTRSNNASNTAYIMNNPTANVAYALSKSVVASASQALTFIAPATGSLLGGAFNILDQIAKAQTYLRSSTANCNVGAAVNFFQDCDPFVAAPVVNTYWTPGLSPGVYQGTSGGISYYLMGKNQLYILGGVNGDSDNSDMDHFDNSVIIHEYGHFIEDNFGRPDSPGGSHNGHSVIDPRLAWGEGWANFFQAVVTGSPVYRDTYGHVGCGGANNEGLPGCTGVLFNENLAPIGSDSYSDQSTAMGEGNFREFSITRVLYAAINPANSVTKFSEIWTAVHGPARGMKVSADRFKGIGRFHVIQQSITGHTNWSALRTNEDQRGNLADYATPFDSTSCASTNMAMAITKSASDNGSFKTSDQMRSNDFYMYAHAGGPLNVSLSWSGADPADLDLYVYAQNYVYGQSSSVVASSVQSSTSTSGTEAVSTSVPAGLYMINVMAYTGSKIYPNPGTFNTTYNLMVNGAPVCPTP